MSHNNFGYEENGEATSETMTEELPEQWADILNQLTGNLENIRPEAQYPSLENRSQIKMDNYINQTALFSDRMSEKELRKLMQFSQQMERRNAHAQRQWGSEVAQSAYRTMLTHQQMHERTGRPVPSWKISGHQHHVSIGGEGILVTRPSNPNPIFSMAETGEWNASDLTAEDATSLSQSFDQATNYLENEYAPTLQNAGITASPNPANLIQTPIPVMNQSPLRVDLELEG